MNLSTLDKSCYLLAYYLKYRYKVVEDEKSELVKEKGKYLENVKSSLFFFRLSKNKSIFDSNYVNWFLLMNENKELLYLYGFLGMAYPTKNLLSYNRFFYTTKLIYRKKKFGFFVKSADNIFFMPKSKVRTRYVFYGVRRLREYRSLNFVLMNYLLKRHYFLESQKSLKVCGTGLILLYLVNIFVKSYFLGDQKIKLKKFKGSSLIVNYYLRSIIVNYKNSFILGNLFSSKRNIGLKKDIVEINKCNLQFYDFVLGLESFMVINKKLLLSLYWQYMLYLMLNEIYFNLSKNALYSIEKGLGCTLKLIRFPDKLYHTLIFKRYNIKSLLRILNVKGRFLLKRKKDFKDKFFILRKVFGNRVLRKIRKNFYARVILFQLSHMEYIKLSFYSYKRILYWMFFYSYLRNVVDKGLMLNYKSYLEKDIKLSVYIRLKKFNSVIKYLNYRYFSYLYLSYIYLCLRYNFVENFYKIKLLKIRKLIIVLKNQLQEEELNKRFIKINKKLEKEVSYLSRVNKYNLKKKRKNGRTKTFISYS